MFMNLSVALSASWEDDVSGISNKFFFLNFGTTRPPVQFVDASRDRVVDRKSATAD